MDDKLKILLDKVILVTKKYPEFKIELCNALNIKRPLLSTNNNISKNVQAIREALEIRANNSVNYDFIKEERLRDQLIIDNLRMENAALNLKENELSRFYIFCVNAFYQIENLLNYYYHKSFDNINEIITDIEEYTKNDIDSASLKKYNYKRTGKETTIGDIVVFYKTNAFCNKFFPNDQVMKINLSNLRKVRNEGEHRCMIIAQEKGNSPLHLFFEKQTFNNIRILLIKLATEVKKQIENANNVRVQEAIIKSNYPGCCFIQINNDTVQVPQELLQIVKDFQKGDKLKVYFKNNQIKNISTT